MGRHHDYNIPRSPLMEGDTQVFYIKEGDLAVLREDIILFKGSIPLTRCRTWGKPIQLYNEWGECVGQTPINYESLTLNDTALVLEKVHNSPESTDWWVLLPEGAKAFVDGRYLVPLGHNRSPTVQKSSDNGVQENCTPV